MYKSLLLEDSKRLELEAERLRKMTSLPGYPTIIPVKDDAKPCPWCGRFCMKDNNCDYIFACGFDDHGVFHVGMGCGRPWCWICGKKYCGVFIDPVSGERKDGREVHDVECCKREEDFSEVTYCSGGHNPHCGKRW